MIEVQAAGPGGGPLFAPGAILESLDSFTDRYAPVQSISGTTITMQQPAWADNNWGYDVLAQPFEGGTMYLENSLSFIQQPGQWSLDSSTGKLYYEAPAGQTMRGVDVELPRLPSLVDISGSYSTPAQGTGNALVSGDNWPAGAQAVISAAGIAQPTPPTQALSG